MEPIWALAIVTEPALWVSRRRIPHRFWCEFVSLCDRNSRQKVGSAARG